VFGIALGLHYAKIPTEITGVVVPGLFGAYPFLVSQLEQRGKTRQEQIEELIKGDITIHPALAVFSIVCYLQFVERTLGAVFGAAIGMSLGIRGYDSDAVRATVATVGPIFVNLLAIFAVIPIARHTTYRARRLPLLLIALGIALDQLINASVAGIVFRIPVFRLIGPVSISGLLLLPGALIGYLWAKRTEAAHIMNRLFRQLSPSDQRSLIDLVRTLPGASITS
jgi:hypothetical protein